MSLIERTYTYNTIEEALSLSKNISGLEYLKGMINGSIPNAPAISSLGIYGVSCDFGLAVFAFKPDDFHYNAVGTVHGGIISTILDTAMGCTLMTTLDENTIFTTLELKVNFLKAVTKNLDELVCEGKIIHAGKTTALIEASLKDKNGVIYAHGVSTCLKMIKKNDK